MRTGTLAGFAAFVAILAASSVHAFTLVFPSSSSPWVACKNNVLQWTTNSTDADIFSVALFNVNNTKVNGNYQIANSLEARNTTALVTPNCVEPGDGYYLLFVNSSQYALGHPQIYFTSQTFSITPRNNNVTAPKGYQLINNGTALQRTDGGSSNVVAQANGTDTADSAPTYGPAVSAQQPSSSSSSSNASGDSNDAARVAAFTLWTMYTATVSMLLALVFV